MAPPPEAQHRRWLVIWNPQTAKAISKWPQNWLPLTWIWKDKLMDLKHWAVICEELLFDRVMAFIIFNVNILCFVGIRWPSSTSAALFLCTFCGRHYKTRKCFDRHFCLFRKTCGLTLSSKQKFKSHMCDPNATRQEYQKSVVNIAIKCINLN